MQPGELDRMMLRVLGVLGVFGSLAGALTTCNAVSTDAGAGRLTAGLVLGVTGLVCFFVGRRRGLSSSS